MAEEEALTGVQRGCIPVDASSRAAAAAAARASGAQGLGLPPVQDVALGVDGDQARHRAPDAHIGAQAPAVVGEEFAALLGAQVVLPLGLVVLVLRHLLVVVVARGLGVRVTVCGR